MHFTYNSYTSLLGLLAAHGYKCASYHDWQTYPRCVILRHDIDYDMTCALEFAERETAAGWRGTYFVLIRSDAYNAFSYNNLNMLRRISEMGHEIGLHFDEVLYSDAVGHKEKIQALILEEADMLGEALGNSVRCVSMHRPSQAILAADLKIPGMVNSYGQIFFHTFKYLSDSRRRWREPVEEIVKSEEYDRLHILTHAFWYREEEENMRATLVKFVNHANDERYRMLRENFTDLDEVMSEEDIKEYARNS